MAAGSANQPASSARSSSSADRSTRKGSGVGSSGAVPATGAIPSKKGAQRPNAAGARVPVRCWAAIASATSPHTRSAAISTHGSFWSR